MTSWIPVRRGTRNTPLRLIVLHGKGAFKTDLRRHRLARKGFALRTAGLSARKKISRRGLEPGRPRNAEDSANAPHRASFDSRMPRDGSLGQIGRIQPNVVVSTVVMQNAPALAQVSLQVVTTHGEILIGQPLQPKGDATVLRAIA